MESQRKDTVVNCIDIIDELQHKISLLAEEAEMRDLADPEAAMMSIMALRAQQKLLLINNYAADCATANKCLSPDGADKSCKTAVTIKEIVRNI